MRKLIDRFIRWLGYIPNEEHKAWVNQLHVDLESQWQCRFDSLVEYMQQKQNDLTALHAFKPGELFDLYKLRESIGSKTYSDDATIGYIYYPDVGCFKLDGILPILPDPSERGRKRQCILERGTLCYQDEKIHLYTYQGNYVRTCNPGDEAKLLQWLRDIVTTDH